MARNVPRARTQRRLTAWIGFVPFVTGFTNTGSAILFTLNAAALALRPFTIVRTRFRLRVVTDQIVASETIMGSFGICVVSDQSTAIGISAVPTPTTDMASDYWLVHQLYYSDPTFAAGLSFDPDPTQYEVDSKAMRKVDLGQDVIVVAEGNSAADGGYDFSAGGRMLIKTN